MGPSLITVDKSLVLDALTSAAPLASVRAPGRINLIGEHTDYVGGKVLPFAIDKAITLEAKRAHLSGVDGALFAALVSDAEPKALVIDQALLEYWLAASATGAEALSGLPDGWARYALGSCVAAVRGIGAEWRSHTAANQAPLLIKISSDIPRGGGLSSSAALCCALITTVTAALGGRSTRLQVARLAQWVEHRFAGTRCGLMDQIAVMFSQADMLTSIDFGGPESAQDTSDLDPVIRMIPFAGTLRDYQAVALDTRVQHELAGSPYNERRRSCELALALLNRSCGRHLPGLGAYARPGNFTAMFGQNPQTLSQAALKTLLASRFFGGHPERNILAARAAHGIMENVRVGKAEAALAAGDAPALSLEMRASHASLSEDYQVSCDELDLLVGDARRVAENLAAQCSLKAPPIIGPRMTGGGFGGNTVQLVHKDLVEAFSAAYGASQHGGDCAPSLYEQKTGRRPGVLATSLAAGLRLNLHGQEKELP